MITSLGSVTQGKGTFSLTLAPPSFITDRQDAPVNVCGDTAPSRGYTETTTPEQKFTKNGLLFILTETCLKSCYSFPEEKLTLIFMA